MKTFNIRYRTSDIKQLALVVNTHTNAQGHEYIFCKSFVKLGKKLFVKCTDILKMVRG